MNTKKILFIAPTRIGDAVLATAILRHLLATQPDARVTIITSTLAAPLFEGYPALERIIPVVKQRYHGHWLKLWCKTVGTRWHAVWDMRNSLLSYSLPAAKRHTYTDPKMVAPKVKQYELAFRTGPLSYPILWPRSEDTEIAKHLLPEGERYLILAPIANWAPKEWPMEHFIALARDLLDNSCKGFRPVVICAGHEREKALPLLNALREYNPIDLTSGEAHLLTIFAAMQRAHGFIGNDSGLMHMAAAACIPTLGLFGPTPHELYQPWGEKAAYIAAGGGDLSTLSPTTVAQTFAALLQPAP